MVLLEKQIVVQIVFLLTLAHVGKLEVRRLLHYTE